MPLSVRLGIAHGQLPLLRASLLSAGGVLVVGLVTASLVVRQVRSRRRAAVQLRAGYGSSQQPQQRPEPPQGKQAPERPQLPIQARSVPAEPADAVPQGPDVREGQELLLDEQLPLAPKALWRLVWDPSFVQRFHAQMGNWECDIGKWATQEGRLVRRCSYVKPLKKNALGPSEAATEEQAVCLHRGDGGWQVEVRAFTRKVPYGGSFHVSLLWSAVRTADGGCRLRVAGGVVFERRVMVGGMIRRAAMEGLRETYAAYREHLRSGAADQPKAAAKSAATSEGKQQPQAAAPDSAATQQPQRQERQQERQGGTSLLLRLARLLTLSLLLLVAALLLPPQLRHRFSRTLSFDRYLEGLRSL